MRSTDETSLDDRTVEGLYARHRIELCNYLRQNFGSGPPDPEDVLQQAFIRYAAVLDAGTPIENARAYLYRAVRNIAIDEYRRAAVTRNVRAHIQAVRGTGNDELNPERVLIGEERLGIMRRVIEAQPEVRRRSFLLNRLEGLGCAEIARRTGYSESAIKKHITVVMLELERALDEAEALTARSKESAGEAHEPHGQVP